MTHDYYKADIDIVIILGRHQKKKEIDVILCSSLYYRNRVAVPAI